MSYTRSLCCFSLPNELSVAIVCNFQKESRVAKPRLCVGLIKPCLDCGSRWCCVQCTECTGSGRRVTLPLSQRSFSDSLSQRCPSTSHSHNHTLTHSHTHLITATCWYDEIKGTKDQDFSCSFSDSLSQHCLIPKLLFTITHSHTHYHLYLFL